MRHARTALLACSLLALAACASGTAPREGAAARAATGPGACLDPSRARSWEEVSDGLLVDAGRDRFLLRIAPGCTGLYTSPTLVFRGDRIGNRVCGYPGDEVVAGHDRCRILSVERLDDAAYARLRGDAPADADADDAEGGD